MDILLVEDNPGDARLIREMCNEQASRSASITHVTSMSEAEKRVAAHRFDIIVLDLGLPDAQGLEAVRRARSIAPRAPLVVLSGLDDESLAVQALQEGAQDYLVKGHIETRGLLRTLHYAVERKAMEAALFATTERAEQAETLLRDAVDSMSEGFVIFDREDRFVMCNEKYRQIVSSRSPRTVALLVPGVQFEKIVGHLRIADEAEAGPGSGGQKAAWFAKRLESHGEATGALEQDVGNGSWLLVTDRRMKNGGIAGLRIDITALKQTQAALGESEMRLDRAQAIAGIGSWELNVATGRYIWSKELYRIRGVSPETFEPDRATAAAGLHPDDTSAVQRWMADLIVGVGRDSCEARIIRPDGELRVLRMEGRPVADPDGVIRRLTGTMQDVTGRRLIEQQLAQAQKMEAIGNLTGGMAHDFNNGLGVIIGNLDLLARLITSNRVAAELCDEARQGALRCADRISRLLAFARRQPLYPRPTDVNALIESLGRMLGRTLRADIALTQRLDDALWPVLADPAQLEAALVNLANNARDAMPKGGQLTITTRNMELNASYALIHPEVNPGEYVLIEVRDTGTGIKPEITSRIFEPFFTTKEPGQGTGLGLSMTFGFVNQSGGHLSVSSEPGSGSTFRIYLPRTQVINSPAPDLAESPLPAGGSETVLIVDDNAPLRRVTARYLEELGYKVREAEHGSGALTALANDDRIDLLFTDVMMPGSIDGIELAQQATQLRRDLKVLLTSGYHSGPNGEKRVTAGPHPFLRKPYCHDDLASAIREALGRDQEVSPGIGVRSTADGFSRTATVDRA